ncbi:DUF3099 domain-containing protein [Aquipuribacter hungaricus]|uniref:DUF3099 domain-containing protein n=1 Tax=Aquipuribacter hungaricus TaxID=545624 RepID=A0ABV7WCQ2_9MICO
MTEQPHDPQRQPRLVQVEVVQSITSARAPHSEDVARRMKAYAVSMGVRTLCVIGLVVVFPHWSAWLFVPGAVVLPYVAVLLANAGRERSPSAPATVVLPPSNLPVLRTTRDDAA